MSTRRLHPSRRRCGVVLPLVLVGMLLVLTMSLVLQQAAWRASRGARTQWDAQRGLYSADAAVVRAFATWPADSMAATAIGTRVNRSVSEAGDWWTGVSIVRTGPLTAVLHASTHRARDAGALGVGDAGRLGDGTRIQRSVLRVVRLNPPAIPILAAATMLGDVALGAATLDGRDQLRGYDPALDDCGPWRDSASVSAIASVAFTNTAIPVLYGSAITLAAATVAPMRERFDIAFPQISARSRRVALVVSGSVASVARWRATVIQPALGVTVNGDSRYVGLLAFDGDLIVHGALRVDGLLVVRGAIDVSTGTLEVRGALVVRDDSARGSHLGARVRVTYAPCLMGRALAAVAMPTTSPFGVFNIP